MDNEIDKMFRDIEAERDARHGKGKWHCDDIADDPQANAAVRAYLDHARAAAHGALNKKKSPLYASHNGIRVRVVMASRFGDVGITKHLERSNGYEVRVLLPELTDFSNSP